MANKSLNELAKQIHETAINHGWWEKERELRLENMEVDMRRKTLNDCEDCWNEEVEG